MGVRIGRTGGSASGIGALAEMTPLGGPERSKVGERSEHSHQWHHFCVMPCSA